MFRLLYSTAVIGSCLYRCLWVWIHTIKLSVNNLALSRHKSHLKYWLQLKLMTFWHSYYLFSWKLKYLKADKIEPVIRFPCLTSGPTRECGHCDRSPPDDCEHGKHFKWLSYNAVRAIVTFYFRHEVLILYYRWVAWCDIWSFNFEYFCFGCHK